MDINDLDSRISCCRHSVQDDPHRHQPSGLRRHRRNLPLGSVGYEAERTEKGEVHSWLEERWVRKLSAR